MQIGCGNQDLGRAPPDRQSTDGAASLTSVDSDILVTGWVNLASFALKSVKFTKPRHDHFKLCHNRKRESARRGRREGLNFAPFRFRHFDVLSPLEIWLHSYENKHS